MFGLSKPQPKAKGAALAQAQNQAPDSIPGMFKPGEFVLPPDTVHAMGGKQALQGVVDATHSQVPVQVDGQAQGLGLKPEVFFANGGAPEDQLKAPISPSNIYPQGSPSAGAGMNRGPGMQFGSSGQFAKVPSGIGGNPAAPARPTAQAPAASPAIAAAPAMAPPAASAPVAAQARTSPGIFPGNRLQGDSGFSGAPIARPAAVAATQEPGAQLKAIADKNSRGESYGNDAPNMANLGLQSPKPAQASAPAAPPATGGLSYSDNMRSIGDDIKRSWGAGNYGEAIGKTVAGTVGGITTPVIDGVVNGASGVSGFARGLFGMESDSSAAAGVPAAASSASPAANRAAPAGYTQASQGVMGPPSRADLAAQGKQVDANLQTMGFNTALARERMGQQGANQRAALAESGASARANGQLGLGLGRLALDQSRAGSEDRLREPQIRAAERIGQMQEAYINAETPEQKAAIASQMRAYGGKDDADWKVQVTPATKNVDGSTSAGSIIRWNTRDGDVQEVSGSQSKQEFVKGTVYQDAKGNKQRWNGTSFESV
ncbi:hypothetical protein [Comamonas sp. 26]|uniref:hypothetical protein n=1 Tax=Comamonas sp. 26 TaxID=2035201 RepID=UPI000C175096|nr:hypothetical protein [Comamonas sp. 26]PIG07840.1 hypothetical protein CLU84_0667 [Comamonas sp. 26]